MRTAIGFGLLLAGIACSRTNNDAADKASDDSRKPDVHAARPEVTEPDNTGKNERDRQPSAVTPEDQGNNESDLKITQQIRQGLMKLDDTSMDAKNVKIITSGGVVTLRGPVDSAQEKAAIAKLAQTASAIESAPRPRFAEGWKANCPPSATGALFTVMSCACAAGAAA